MLTYNLLKEIYKSCKKCSKKIKRNNGDLDFDDLYGKPILRKTIKTYIKYLRQY